MGIVIGEEPKDKTPTEEATDFIRSRFSPEAQYRPIHLQERELAALLVEFLQESCICLPGSE